MTEEIKKTADAKSSGESKEETKVEAPAEAKVKEESKSADAKSSSEPKEKKTVEVPAKFKTLVESVEKLSVIELSELVKVLEEKFGVSAQAPVAVVAEDGEADVAEEKTSFNVELVDIGVQKIEVIKAVRDITAKGLKESKDLVDAVAAGTPQIIQEGVKKDVADELVKKFEAAGAKVEVK